MQAYTMCLMWKKPWHQGREFSEARGLVTAAYQNQLEKEWLEALRKKYTIKVHETALYGLGGE